MVVAVSLRRIFLLVRFLIGVVGVLGLAGGAYGAIYAGSDYAWGPAVGAVVTALFGFCVAYGAFVRAPWETSRGGDGRIA